MNEVAACKSVLIEVLTILGKDLDHLVVVGGWVPELIFPNKGHIGSLDVDLALDPRELKPLAYESIRKKLVDAGYEQSSDKPNCFFRKIEGTEQVIKVDLITGEFPALTEAGTHIPIQELTVAKLRGIDLAFDFQQSVAVDGVLPGGGHNRVVAKLPTIAAYLCMKAITISERMKEKDAYDICFCIDNYPGGYKALANEFRIITDNALITEGMRILQEKFARIDSIGPVWAANTIAQGTSGSDIEMEQRRAFELVNALLGEIAASKKE